MKYFLFGVLFCLLAGCGKTPDSCTLYDGCEENPEAQVVPTEGLDTAQETANIEQLFALFEDIKITTNSEFDEPMPTTFTWIDQQKDGYGIVIEETSEPSPLFDYFSRNGRKKIAEADDQGATRYGFGYIKDDVQCMIYQTVVSSSDEGVVVKMEISCGISS